MPSVGDRMFGAIKEKQDEVDGRGRGGREGGGREANEAVSKCLSWRR